MFVAGLCWILATLTRPDHAIFYAVGSAVVLGIWIVPLARAIRSRAGLRAAWTAGLAPMVGYAAPFGLWLIHAAWKLDYYGALLPNTYHAKSADLPYWSQGLVYAADFHLSSHLWIALLVLTIALPFARPSQGPGRRLLAYVLPAVIVYELYVMRVGGDFMEGRFYVSLIPLILLVGELAIHELSRRRHAWPAILVASLLAATAFGVRLVPPRDSLWYLTDESSYYPITRWSPIVIGHSNYQTGVILGRLHASGVEPIIASGAIGLIGYYSGMTMIDRLGLVDATVAHQAIRERGRPGHEKWATTAYLEQRGVHFVRGGPYPPWFRQGAIHWGQRGGRTWWILRYDRELMQAIREADPEVRFEDFPSWLDRHLVGLPRRPPADVRREFGFFRRYYFDHHDDPMRRRAYETYLDWVAQDRDPAELLEQGRWKAWQRKRAIPGN
jgi:arabinofuranosyltransferase